ncbi:MAG TPA: hypothetical protein VGM54_16115 [Chthoniobacter sp.]|jgi:hypothetical protein
MAARNRRKGHAARKAPLRCNPVSYPGVSPAAANAGDHANFCRVKGRICIDKITGLPMLKASAKAQKLTSQQVSEMLAEFP